MEVFARLTDLASMHPRLLWNDVAASAAAVFKECGFDSRCRLQVETSEVPGFLDRTLELEIDRSGISQVRQARVRRTYDSARLVELAAIAVAGLALYHAGKHTLRDIARRGTGADYLVDDEKHLLEVAGRSRRRDLESVRAARLKR